MNTDKKIDYDNIDYDAVSAWAENDMELLPVNPETTKSGTEAAKSGREVLARAGVGRPSLAGKGKAGTSPVRQFRLSPKLSANLDALAKVQDRRPSDVMREAVEVYVRNHSTSA